MRWKQIDSEAEVAFGEDAGAAEAPIRPGRRPAGDGSWQPHRFAEETAGYRVQAVIAPARARPPLSHLLDEGRVPDAAMRGEAAGRQNRIERIDDPEVLGSAR